MTPTEQQAIDRNPIKRKIAAVLTVDEQAIIYRALSELSRATQSEEFKRGVLTLRKRLEDKGKKP